MDYNNRIKINTMEYNNMNNMNPTQPAKTENGNSSNNSNNGNNRSLLLCIVVLLLLNFLFAIGTLVILGVSLNYVASAKAQIQNFTTSINDQIDGMGFLPQISKVVATNLDLSTWSSMFADASNLLDQVKSVDWTVKENYDQFHYSDCSESPQEYDKPTCLSFTGDDGKKCAWYDGTNPPGNPNCDPQGNAGCCWGSAQKAGVKSTQTIEVQERDSQQVQTFIKNLKAALDTAVTKLPSKNGKKGTTPTPSHPGLSNKTCAANPKPLKVDSSLINVPATVDTLLRDFPCLVTKIDDQFDYVTADVVKAIYEAMQKINGYTPDPKYHQEDNFVNQFVAYAKFFKTFGDKFITTLPPVDPK